MSWIVWYVVVGHAMNKRRLTQWMAAVRRRHEAPHESEARGGGREGYGTLLGEKIVGIGVGFDGDGSLEVFLHEEREEQATIGGGRARRASSNGGSIIDRIFLFVLCSAGAGAASRGLWFIYDIVSSSPSSAPRRGLAPPLTRTTLPNDFWS